MAREMYENRLAQFRPLLHPVIKKFSCKGQSSVPCILLRNVGPGPALDIDITCRGDFTVDYHIPFFGPGEKIEIELQAQDKTLSGPHKIIVETKYQDLFSNVIVVNSRYRFDQQDYTKKVIFPEDTVMKGKI